MKIILNKFIALYEKEIILDYNNDIPTKRYLQALIVYICGLLPSCKLEILANIMSVLANL